MKKAYFIGIGGIGMSALAQFYADVGVAVSGSDRDESPVTELLCAKGIEVYKSQDGSHVPEDTDLVIYSEAVWEDNPERMRVKELGIPEQSYFEALGDVSKRKRTIAVSGTHGKTTTTGMLAKILSDAGASPTAIVGSLVKDFGSNYLKGESDIFVVEACEYKRDFLTLSPEIVVVTNIEWEHTDYYKTLADVQVAFLELMQKAKTIVTNPHDPNIAPLLEGLSVPVVDYTKEPETPLSLLGEFNQQNARAAIATARLIVPALESTMIYHSTSTFAGTWRRFEYKGKTKKGADVYDDYAHHPTAVRKTIAELKKKPHSKIFVAFHPHLYSRTRDLLPEFAKAFKDADRVIIAPIYPAREVDDGSISNEILAQKIEEQGTLAQAGDFTEIKRYFETEPTAGDIIMTMGAGDIYHVADALVSHS